VGDCPIPLTYNLPLDAFYFLVSVPDHVDKGALQARISRKGASIARSVSMIISRAIHQWPKSQSAVAVM
jgi:hypothetical protein